MITPASGECVPKCVLGCVQRVSSCQPDARTIAPMNRFLRVLVSALVAGLSLAPQTLAAQELTPDLVEAAFIHAGFEVEASMDWSWLSPAHTTLRVRDRANERVLLVLVYKDASPAAVERLMAHAPLVPGFGPSAWWHNVALVQANQFDLDRWYAAELTRSTAMPGPPNASGSVAPSVVAAAFLAALAAPGLADF